MADLKRGTPVKVSFTGKMVERPLTFRSLDGKGVPSPARIRVDGLTGWWAVVPESVVETIEPGMSEAEVHEALAQSEAYARALYETFGFFVYDLNPLPDWNSESMLPEQHIWYQFAAQVKDRQ